MADKKAWRGRPFVYGAIRSVLFNAYKFFFRFRAFGAGNVPTDRDPRGVILAPNHSSFLDPPILGIALKRPVTYLAKEYLFRAPIVGWTLRSVGAYPIKTRTDDFKTIRDLLRLLKNGECITIFPEGTRSPDGSLQRAEGGVGFLAVKSAAYVVPVYIRGTFDAFPRDAKFFKCKPVDV